MRFLTESGSWFNGQELKERKLAGISNFIIAGEDEDGNWTYILMEETKTKRKGGKDLHASDFAYVGDSQDPSTWKLPIHDAAHARNALARFNQTQGIPSDEKAAVLAKIKRAAKKFGVDVSERAESSVGLIEIEAGYPELEALILAEAGGGEWITKDGRRVFVGQSNAKPRPAYIPRPPIDSGHRGQTEEVLRNNGYERTTLPASNEPGNFEAQGHNWIHPDRPTEKVFVDNQGWEFKSGHTSQTGTHAQSQDLAGIVAERAKYSLSRRVPYHMSGNQIDASEFDPSAYSNPGPSAPSLGGGFGAQD